MPTINELYASGGFVFAVELRALEDDTDWFATIFSAVFGVFQIVIGVALMAIPGAGVFTTTMATSLIAQGAGDIVSSVAAFITKNPIQLDNYLKSKAIGFAASLIAASALHALSSIQSLNDLLKITTKVEEFRKEFDVLTHLTYQFTFSATASTIGTAVARATDKVIDKNSGAIKGQAKKLVSRIIEAQYEEHLRLAFAYELLATSDKYSSMMATSAIEITRDYSTRFRGTGEQVGRSAGGQVVGSALGGFGVGGQVASTVINAGTDVALGAIKFAETEGDFRPKLEEKMGHMNVPHTRELMGLELARDTVIGEQSSAQIMQLLATDKTFGINSQDINWRNCAGIKDIDLQKFAEYQQRIIDACEHVATYMSDNAQSTKREHLEQVLSHILFESLKGTLKYDIASPLASVASNIAAGFIAKPVAEHIEAALRDLTATQPQVTVVQNKAEAVKTTVKEGLTKRLNKPANDNSKQYRIQPGDTLSDIAKKSGISEEALLAANPRIKDANKIYAGTMLNVPTGGSVSAQASKADTQSQQPMQNPAEHEYNTIKTDPATQCGGAADASSCMAKNIKPSIEFFARDVENTKGKYQHGYTIFTYSDGKKIIVTGFPERNNMMRGDLKGVVTEYTKENFRAGLFPKGDWTVDVKENDIGRTTIKKWEFNTDAELDSYLSKAKKAINFVETGNNGKRFDYDLCVSDKCWGSNSNTVQKIIYKEIGLSYEIPSKLSMPGINGKIFDGPLDDFWRKYGEELQKEQP